MPSFAIFVCVCVCVCMWVLCASACSAVLVLPSYFHSESLAAASIFFFFIFVFFLVKFISSFLSRFHSSEHLLPAHQGPDRVGRDLPIEPRSRLFLLGFYRVFLSDAAFLRDFTVVLLVSRRFTGFYLVLWWITWFSWDSHGFARFYLV